MPDAIVKSHIDTFLQSLTPEIAVSGLGIISDDVSVSTKVRATSAAWSSTTGDDVAVSTKVRASSAYWDSTYTTVSANSAAWSSPVDSVTVRLANVNDNYTLTLSDAGRYVRVGNINNATKTISIPAQALVDWELGTSITIKNTTNYTMNISGTNGVTIYYATSSFGPLGVLQIVNVAADTWDIL